MIKCIRNLRKDSSAASLIEFSLLLPFLILIVAGMAEFGRALHQYHVATKGVKNAARYLARVVDDGSCPPISGDWANAVTQAKTLAQKGGFDASQPYRLSNWTNAADITVSVTCFDNSTSIYRGNDLIPLITVSTSFTFDDIGLISLMNINDLTALTVATSHQQLFIGG